ncbi:MAG: lamin tail domain-containing protein [Deltaproteobacteria bacterium]|nr:MAG: lamin tail domain-containing protein [Deltaproteobacteria bacterium]
MPAEDTATPAEDTATPSDDTTPSADTATPAEDTAVADTVAPVARVVINEVVAARLDGGDDWVELYNAGGADADLSGWALADDSDNSYVIADGTTLAPGAFLVFEETELAFGLGKDDAVTLTDTDGAAVDLADWGEGDAPGGWSYGRLPDGEGPFRTLNHPTPGAANDDVLVTVVLNEVVAAAADGGDDWIELYVPGSGAQDVSGWVLGDDGGNTWEIPADTVLAGGEHRVFTQTAFGFGLGKADAVLLFDGDGVLLQATAWIDGDADAGTSWGRSPDGTGDFATLTAQTPGAANP